MGGLVKGYTEATPVAFPSTTPLIIYETMTTSIFTFYKTEKNYFPVLWKLTVHMAQKPDSMILNTCGCMK